MEIKKEVKAVYTKFFAGEITEIKKKDELNKLYMKVSDEMPVMDWCELLLDAQWEDATEEDYEATRQANLAAAEGF